MIERKIIIGCIVSADYLRQIRNIWDPQLLEATIAKRLTTWCWEYFDRYDKAPGKDIEGIFYSKLKGSKLPKDLAEEIEEDILPGLSKEYEGETFNLDYLLEETQKYFKERRLQVLSENISGLLSNGELMEAEKVACEYKPILSGVKEDLDLSNSISLDRVDKAFTTSNVPLIKYPRQLGEFWNGQLVRGSFVALMASEKRGKCLPGTQKVLLNTGEELSINDLYKRNRRSIISYDEKNCQFITTKISKFWKNGIKDVYEVTTRTGRKVQVTYNHPFLTPQGWRDLSQISKGDFIAVPKETPVFGRFKLDDIQIKLLAYFITEGYLQEYTYKVKNKVCKYKVIGFTSADLDIQKDFTICIRKMKCEVSWRGIDARVINSMLNKGIHNKNYVLKMLKKYKLYNKLACEKTIPNIIYKLPKQKLALFLKVLYTCDGWINKGKDSQVGFAVANEALARQVHSLLTRFGIVSKLYFHPNPKKGSWSVTINGYENIIKYSKEIGFLYKKQEKMEEVISKIPISYKSFLDKFPWGVAFQFYNEVKSELGNGVRVEKRRDSKQSVFHNIFKRELSTKAQINKKTSIMRQSFLGVKNTKTGQKYFNSSILWDEVMKIQFVDRMETFDLTVEKYHNFIAENILVHNTFWLLDMAIRACKQGRKVAFFQAGDMTEDQQLKRICVYLARKSDLKKYSGKMWEPVRDCVKNQMNDCDNELRECTFGIFEGDSFDDIRKGKELIDLIKAYKDNKTYKTCYNCNRYWTNHWGAVWIKEVDTGDPLTVNEAKIVLSKFFLLSKRQFKLSTHANGTLTVKQIKALLSIWEKQDNFIPDIIVVDYADLLVGETKEFRQLQNEIWKGLRNLSQEKGQPLVITATQADAKSYEQNRLRLSNFSEDKRKYAHVTAMWGLNQDTKDREKKIGLMRINEMVVREGEFSSTNEVTILQNLKRGRPFLGSYF